MISLILISLTPLFCSFGVLTNGLNVLVLKRTNTKDTLFKYMLASSIIDLVYLLLGTYDFIEFCSDIQCLFKTCYWSQIYIIYIADYLTSCLALFRIFLEIFISIERYLIVLNKKYLANLPYYLVILFLFIVSLLFYLPLLFFKEITTKSNDNITMNYSMQFEIVTNDLGLSLFGRFIPILLTFLRIFLGTIVLVVINLMSVYEFKKRFSITNSLNSKSSILFF